MKPGTPARKRPASPDPHQALVDSLLSEGHIRSPRVEGAFRAVPRHRFLPGVAREQVYRNEVVVTKEIDGVAVSSSSQPAIMAIMLEQLGLEPGQRVLEIGAGTGYNAALLAHLVGDTGRVVTMDIDPEIVEKARAHLAAAGLDRVEVVCGDGGLGHAPGAPYDRVILTVGSWDIAPAWWEQLKPGGRLVLPLSLTHRVVRSVAFERKEDHLASLSVTCCGFMMLRGAFAAPEGHVALGDGSGLHLLSEDASRVDGEAVYSLLQAPYRDLPTRMWVTSREVSDSLLPWLQLREPGFCTLWEEGEALTRRLVPYLFGIEGRHCSASGLAERHGLSLLACPFDQELPSREPADTPFELFLRSFGEDSALTRRLFNHVRTWDAAGRPEDDIQTIRAYPKESRPLPDAAEFIVPKRWTRLVIRGATPAVITLQGTPPPVTMPHFEIKPPAAPETVRAEATERLHEAIRRGDAIVIERMLKSGADPAAPIPSSGRTAIELATDLGETEILQRLIREGGDTPAGETAPRAGGGAKAAPETAEAAEPSLKSLLDELDGLVGLGSVKADVTQLVNFLRVQRMRKERGLSVPEQSLHMVFYGNPGTGKTTIARLLAKIYKSLGILTKGHFVETDRAGLVAAYLGQTAIKVRETVGRSRGGVLFIDEAYNLIQSDGGHDAYGHEAVATLLKLMEDHREDLVVIVAGYPALMQRFLRSNPGLQSRFNKYLNFPDYSAEELTEIFFQFARRNDYRLTEEAAARIQALFEGFHGRRDETFGNARLARNLFERAINRHADRLVTAVSPDADALMTLHPEDIPGE